MRILVIAVAFSGFCFLQRSHSSALTLASGGSANVVIVTPEEPSPSVARAARELQRFLGEMTGAEFECVSESASLAEHEIVLGAPGRFRELGVRVDEERLGA